MQKQIDFKRVFVIVIIISLVLCAIIGILIFIFGSFEQTQLDILLTSLSLALASIAGLADTSLYTRNKYQIFSLTGLAVTGIAFLLSLILIWESSAFTQGLGQWFITFIVIAGAFAHISLLLLIEPKAKFIEYIQLSTFVIIGIVVLIIIYIIFATPSEDLYVRFLGTFAILDVLGTIVTPLINKFYTPSPSL
jgi:hypothetical protein